MNKTFVGRDELRIVYKYMYIYNKEADADFTLKKRSTCLFWPLVTST